MATTRLFFPIRGFQPADGTGTVNNPPDAFVRVSSAAQGSNAPKVTWPSWAFDPATDEHLLFTFRMPGDYVSGGTVIVQFANKAVQTGTNTVFFKGCLAAVTPNAGTPEKFADKAFPTADTFSKALNANAAADEVYETSVVLSATALNSVVAGDAVVLMVGRDADNASDTVTGDVELITVALEYTS